MPAHNSETRHQPAVGASMGMNMAGPTASKGEKISVLVCGDAGPARHALLARTELHLLWADGVESARGILRHARPRVCVMRSRLADGPALDLVRTVRAEHDVPCIVLLSTNELGHASHYIDAGAEIFEIGRTQAILKRVEDFTGVPFAALPRVRFETIAEVTVAGRRIVVETKDLNTQGVGVTDFPNVPAETEVEIDFLKESPRMKLVAVVARRTPGSAQVAGLCFVRLSREQREWLNEAMKRCANKLPRPRHALESLFEEVPQLGRANVEDDRFDASVDGDGDDADVVAPLATGDIGPPRADVEAYLAKPDPDLAVLRRWVLAESAGEQLDEAPAWVRQLCDTLTVVERSSILGEPAPRWARWALNLRIKLLNARQSDTQSPEAATLIEYAYQYFQLLPKLVGDVDEDLMSDMGAIRAAILRELLGREAIRRSEDSTPDRASEWILEQEISRHPAPAHPQENANAAASPSAAQPGSGPARISVADVPQSKRPSHGV